MRCARVIIMTVFSVNDQTGAVHRPEWMNYYLLKGAEINPRGMGCVRES